LLLGTARRLFRPDESEPLMPIRSFRFFLPILDELRFAPVDSRYVNYLAQKIADATGIQITLNVTTDPERRRKRRKPRQLGLPWT
jgi:hypothetical protein